MNKLRWAMDGGFWDVDVSTPMTLNGIARPVPGDPLPLGLSRGVRLSRPKQIDFFQRFMTMPFVPCFNQRHGTSLQRVFSFPFGQRWFLTLLEAAWPGLFIDQHGTYCDVPFTTTIDLASVSADAGASYHVCVNHNGGSPKQFECQPTGSVAATLLPGLCAKGALSLKKNIDIWKSEAQKLKMVQPYDLFLSNPHISASGILGAVITASLGENSIRAPPENGSEWFKGFGLHYRGANSAILADVFASVSLSAQHGNFQRMFLDLTRFYGRLDFPSGSNFVSGATCLASNFYNSQAPSLDAVQAICPSATLSLQQQIAGPFSFRVDSGVSLDLKNRECHVNVRDPVYAIEYALQVLGSAKAVAWYSPKQREFMIELRFFER
ncbi:hypothetical protein RJ639_007141 [Escallonia herrerae]|uniref:Uncharacterized protein n=1 Tax=Escallonia herrerae TaxID=1293975 RepID=A0AA88W050_9ASTE|nr:hypothetical protein RJ639_007141 [Escallonia herrerae]